MKLLAALVVSASLISTSAFASEEPAKPAAAPAAAKPDLNAGAAKFAATCAACHGADGNSPSPANPKLAGQGAEYLVRQLHDFKSGKRASPVMSGMVAGLTEGDMVNIGHWLAAQKPKASFAKDKARVALGEKIYRGGIAERQVPACAGCHGPSGAGIPSQFPRIAGQHADYVAAQLTGFRDGTRKNSPWMSQVSSNLKDKEIVALADYVAGLR